MVPLSDAGDDDELAVIADALLERGDPRGELIAAQRALAALPKAAPQARRGALTRTIDRVLDVHHDALFGALAPHVDRASRPDLRLPALVVEVWRAGFAEVITLNAPMGGPTLAEVHVAMRALPICARVRELRLGVGTDPAAAAAIAADPPPTLRTLWLTHAGFREPRQPGRLDDLGPLATVAGQLTTLRIEQMSQSPPLRSTTLRELFFFAPTAGTSIVDSALPNLVDLTLSQDTLTDAVWARFPALARLCCYDVERPAGWLARALAQPTLRTLELTVEDDEFEVLVNTPSHVQVTGRCWRISRERADAYRARVPAHVTLT